MAKDYIENFLIYNNGSTPGQLNLNNGHLRLDQSFGTGAQLTLAGAAEINVTGTKNQITAPGGALVEALMKPSCTYILAASWKSMAQPNSTCATLAICKWIKGAN